ncbi:MAG: oxygen-independent coproporphyrinogen III oxidase [Opitutaceae bacterium]|nr:oxygen-independent coproporphyrinogen III oxidase [Opitutaceae bacterium]
MSTNLSVNLDLIRKYNVAGPRYTSYPTALQFTEEFDRKDIETQIDENNKEATPLSLYFHLPFCETLCWFCGCTTVISSDHSRTDPYLDHLEKEMQITSPLINKEREVIQMHFGGGSPNYLSPAQIRRLGKNIHENFHFAPDAELSVELDPRRLTKDHIDAFNEMGINRASIGIQDFNPKVQEAVNRIQPKEVSDQAIAWIREAGYQSLNIDLIYGLPYQTAESFQETLNLALESKPDRFAIFSYAHVPWMKPAQKLFKVLPDPETKLEMLKRTIETLTSNGYTYIGMDHFAREDDELAIAQRKKTLQRNFQGYSTRGGADIYGFGMSSISQTNAHYRQNHKTLPSYYAAIEKGELPISKICTLTTDDFIRRETIMRLMCDLELNYQNLSHLLKIDFKDYFSNEIASFENEEADGLITSNSEGITVTDNGRLLIRNLAMRFDAYLNSSENRFSRTI